jgi:hypothetical protein
VRHTGSAACTGRSKTKFINAHDTVKVMHDSRQLCVCMKYKPSQHSKSTWHAFCPMSLAAVSKISMLGVCMCVARMLYPRGEVVQVPVVGAFSRVRGNGDRIAVVGAIRSCSVADNECTMATPSTGSVSAVAPHFAQRLVCDGTRVHVSGQDLGAIGRSRAAVSVPHEGKPKTFGHERQENTLQYTLHPFFRGGSPYRYAVAALKAGFQEALQSRSRLHSVLVNESPIDVQNHTEPLLSL